jgi:uncharacterized SAM-binding protein YcdF (DUF218 family)
LNESADRLTEAVVLASRFPDIPVIFSGGSGDLTGNQPPEADLAHKFFEAFKIAPPRLRLEARSRNTAENATFTAELLKPRADQKWILVTSAYHMPRAKALFEAQGFRLLPWPVDFRTNGWPSWWEFFPRASLGLGRLDLAAKEWVGIGVSWLKGDIVRFK